MRWLTAIYAVARADFLERIRCFGFVVTLVVAVVAAYAFVPPNHASYSTLHFAEYRGIYNSAWVGAQVALLSTVYLFLIGFYLVRGGISRDRQTRVGQIVAGTPISNAVYTLGKWLANLTVLGSIVTVLIITAATLQLIRGEVTAVRPISLIAPFLYLVLPIAALVAALAILFECTPILRGIPGTVGYVLVAWGMILGELMTSSRFLGVQHVMDNMRAVCHTAFPAYTTGRSFGFDVHPDGGVWNLITYVWGGLPLSSDFLLSRAWWCLAALGITLVATIPFDRFDAAGVRSRDGLRSRFKRLRNGRGHAGYVHQKGELAADASSVSARLPLTPLAGGSPHTRFGAMLVAQVRLALKGTSWWWHLGALGLIAAQVFAPADTVQAFVLPGAWLWPLIIWSPLGHREIFHATHEIEFATPRSVSSQVATVWLSCVVIVLVMTGGAGVKWLMAGEWTRLAALVVGAAFVPSLALALGAWTRSSRFFQVLYIAWWYNGPFSGVAVLDYAGVSAQGGAPTVTVAYALATLVLLITGAAGVHRQMQS
ncbi:MAG TPA: hypothetical protein VM118_15155 [Acidobacteriota bacterium]|nr:hypothetical protein [Acidobacteriota bacterium]